MNEVEKDYRKNPALNYSLLKQVADNPSQIQDKKDISEYPSVKRGDILDMMFEDKEAVFKKYQYFDGEIPTAMSLQAADKMIEYCKVIGEAPSAKLGLEIARENDLWKTSKDDTILKKFDDNFFSYVNFYLDTDKIIVTKDILDDVEEAYNSILTHEHTKEIFDFTKRKVIYQQPIYTTYKYEKDGKLKEEKIKVLVDIISIDEDRKIIYPYDTKFLTDYSVFSFPKRFLQMYYYIQSGLYTYAINKWAKENYPDYKVVNYNFIAISTKNLSLPIVFDAFDYTIPSRIGFEINGRHYPGINQLIEDYRWHEENDLWSYRRELYENKGVIKLKL
ncbi:MAG TPA: hypothetical protein VK982_01440 [Bacteroidales bacterium]|nr:hypothetical protein [Bacteroidales bacterium]